MEFKVGDKVIIDNINGWYGFVKENLEKYLNKIGIVKSVNIHHDYTKMIRVRINIGEKSFFEHSFFEHNLKPVDHSIIGSNIKKIIFNPPATIITWGDNTKTVVKTTKGDKYNPVFGVLLAYFQKHSGLSKTQANKFCDNIFDEFTKQQNKKKKVNKI